MKVFKATALLAACGAVKSAQVLTNPLGKVLTLMDELAQKVTQEGEAEAKAYREYFEWCDDASKNTNFAIKTATNEKLKLEAKIGQLAGDIEAAGSKIQELSAAIAESEAEVKSASLIRDKEAAVFAAGEQELMDGIDTLGRAISILQKEMSNNPASLAQVDTSNMASVVQAFGTVLDAASFTGTDRQKLVALVQSRQASEDGDAELGAPAAATYKSQSGGIVDVLEDMKDKAEAELSDMRKAETNSRHNFGMLRQSLQDQMAADGKDFDRERAGKAAAQEGKATAEGDLEMATKDLASAEEQLATSHDACMRTAADHEQTVTARSQELEVIAQAKNILQETSSGAVSQTYSFVQVATVSAAGSKGDRTSSKVVAMVQQVARSQHSSALAQLASRVAAVAKFGASGGGDAFGKIRGLISDMIAKLEREAGDEATEKAYCDEQMAKTEAKKGELDADLAKMTASIDTAAARSAELKAQVQELETELANLAREQAQMDKIRQETHADYKIAKADLELGLTGVRKALSVLRDYYGATAVAAFAQQPAVPEKHSKAAGAGSSIIGILEVVESDFATGLAKEETQEADAQTEYEKVGQENKITKTTKDQDVKYKTQESKSLDTEIAELSSDRETSSSELSAVLEYYAKVKQRCIAKPETYEERQGRRDAEIHGLKEALTVLNEETAFVQRKRLGGLRGSIAAY